MSVPAIDLLTCKFCNELLNPKMKKSQVSCDRCAHFYLKDNIFFNNLQDNIDLRMPETLTNMHEVRKQKTLHGVPIESEVEYVARVYSIDFSNLHHNVLLPYLNGNSVIGDIGCGQIPYINQFSSNEVAAYYAFDLSRESLNIAKDNFLGQFPLILTETSVYDIPLKKESLDICISSEVIEHVDDPFLYLKEINRILKTGGILSLSTPCASLYLYPDQWINIVKGCLKGNFTPLYELKKFLCPEQHWQEALSWHPGLRPSILRKWLEDTGFQVISHKTCLPYYHNIYRIAWRLFAALEEKGFTWAGKAFKYYIKSLDKIISLGIPILKWAGIRQFILVRKL